MSLYCSSELVPATDIRLATPSATELRSSVKEAKYFPASSGLDTFIGLRVFTKAFRTTSVYFVWTLLDSCTGCQGWG